MKIPELKAYQVEEEITEKLYRKGWNDAVKLMAELNKEELKDEQDGYVRGILRSSPLRTNSGDFGTDQFPGIPNDQLPICSACGGKGLAHIHTCPVLKGEKVDGQC